LAHRWLESGNPDVREAYILWVSGGPHARNPLAALNLSD
jgi:hypothetical protein